MTGEGADDVVVVGAGLFGASVARECALRGLSVTLVSHTEVAAGASRVGPVLLGDDLPTGGDARALSALAALAPHLVAIVPVHGVGLGSIVDITRLTQLYVIDAIQRGARLRLGTRVLRVERDESAGPVAQRVIVDGGDAIRAAQVVIATGASKILGADREDPSRRLLRTIDVGIVSPREGRLAGDLLLYPTRGGARVIVPTDDLTDAKEALRAFDLVGAPVMRSEVLEVSVASAPRGDALPGIARITESLPGAHRAVAIFLADAFSRAAGRGLGSPPKDAPLPGGGSLVRVAPLSEHFHVPDLAVRRLVSRHGALTDHVLGRTLAAPAERALVCSCEAILECEIRHACSVEGSKSIDDVARRTTLGAGACHGLDCLHRAAQIVRSETGADASTTRRRVDELVRVRFDARAPFLRPSDLGREELALGRLVAAGAAAREEP